MGEFDQVPHQKKIRVVGYTELDDRPAFKMSILEVNGSWFMYVGHLWHSGWSIIDVTDPANPYLLSLLPVPAPPPGAPYRNFCEKGGRFGPHNLNHNYHNPFVQQRDDLLYVTYFNAGLRIFDMTDPRLPVETGYFIPPNPKRRYGPKPERVLAAQSEDVLVDARGIIYLTDKNQGIWILRYVEEEESP